MTDVLASNVQHAGAECGLRLQMQVTGLSLGGQHAMNELASCRKWLNMQNVGGAHLLSFVAQTMHLSMNVTSILVATSTSAWLRLT